MSDTSSLTDPRWTLILWNAASPKWQDSGNNFFCSDRLGRWLVSARYNFENDLPDMTFETGHEAMQFFVNYLHSRNMRLAYGEKEPLAAGRLLDPRFDLILWNSLSGKWQDRANDFFCSDRHGRGWCVSARYGFEDGRRDIEFASEHEAMEFFVNYLYARRMRRLEEPRAA